MSFPFVLNSLPDSRMFGLDLQTFVQVIFPNLFNVALLAVIMYRLLQKPVRKFMAQRAERIRAALDGAAEESLKAGELKAKYEQKLKDIGTERAELMDDARRRADETGRQIVAAAKAEADALKTRAAEGIRLEQERVKEEMRLAIIEVASAMAGKIVSSVLDEEAHQKLFAETMAELEGKTWRS